MSKWPPATVRFATHEAACGARLAAKELKHIAGGIDTEYNERSYDGRKDEAGLDDDDGRGVLIIPIRSGELSLPCTAVLLKVSNRDTGRLVCARDVGEQRADRAAAGLPKDVGGAGGTAAQNACTQQQRA